MHESPLFAYNGFGARVSKTDSAGTTTYLRSRTSVVAPVAADSQAVYTPGICERRGSDSRFYHGDIKNFVEQTDSSGPQTAVAVGPLPKRLVNASGLVRVVETPGSSPYTSGIRLAAILTRSRLLHSAANFVKAKHALIWLYFEVGAAWYATYKTLNDPDVWVTEP